MEQNTHIKRELPHNNEAHMHVSGDQGPQTGYFQRQIFLYRLCLVIGHKSEHRTSASPGFSTKINSILNVAMPKCKSSRVKDLKML